MFYVNKKKKLKQFLLVLLVWRSMNIVYPQEPNLALCISSICKYICIWIFLVHQLNYYIKIFMTINSYLACLSSNCPYIIIALCIIFYLYDIHNGAQAGITVTEHMLTLLNLLTKQLYKPLMGNIDKSPNQTSIYKFSNLLTEYNARKHKCVVFLLWYW